jgi:transcriptional regulator with XRE-family HTH domain
MQGPPFRARLEKELQERQKVNLRYSLRAFAAFLGTDHSTLSQILRGKRRAPTAQIRAWAKKLDIDAEEAAAYIAAEHLPGPGQTERESQIRHWTAESMAIVSDSTHWDIVRLSRTPGLRPDSRWMAEQVGVSIDQVNMAFQRLLRLRLIDTDSAGRWIDLMTPPASTEREFRRAALARVREKAAESKIKLPRS